MDTKRNLERIYAIWAWVLLLWCVYRYFARLPEWADDLVAKPIIFLGPVLFYVMSKERRPLASIGLAAGKFFRDIYLGIGFGMLFALEGLMTNLVKHGKFSFLPVIAMGTGNLFLYVILSVSAAICEEVLVRGFLYTRLKENYGSELKAMVVSTAMYFFLLIPAVFLVTKLNGLTLVIFLMTNLVLSFANTMIFSETKTVTVPVLIRAFWNMAVALYL